MVINKVLVVDDSNTDRIHLTQIIEGAGMRAISAASGSEALEMAKKDKPDLIFLDIVMDEMDGYQTCRSLTNENETKDIPVVMVSSKKQRADKIWAKQQGAQAYIEKPYTKEEILEVISSF